MKATGDEWWKMDKLVNLNSLVEDVLASKDTTAAQQLLTCNLSGLSVLAAIRKTKNYSALQTFASLINFKDNPQWKELALIYVDAIADGTIYEMEKYISNSQGIDNGSVSFGCGEQGLKYENIPGKIKALFSYCGGLAFSDNLEMLLQYSPQLTSLHEVYRCAGKGCAKQVMNHYGFAVDRVKEYVSGAITGKNKETLLFLREYPEEIEYEFLKCMGNILLPEYKLFLTGCLREGIVKFSEKGWLDLQWKNESLYDSLQNDV